MRFLVTGGRGFIGSHFVELALSKGHKVIDVDKLSYASNKILPFDSNLDYEFIEKDISKIQHLPMCDIVFNFAAESHVDNSIVSPKVFFDSNTKGVFNLLELIRGKIYKRPLFFHISTDEVYGDIRDSEFKENDKLAPSNPYSASKAAAEMFILSYSRTYNLEYLITRSSNNYGERQYHEKLLPQILYCLKNDIPIPIHGDGTYIRDWIYVKDNVEAIYFLSQQEKVNEIYNISNQNHMSNLDVVKEVCSWYDVVDYEQKIKFVANRFGQDIRYSINSDKLKNLGFNFKRNRGLYKFI